MSTRAANYLDAVEHLPADAMLILHDVSWDDYEHLLEDLEARPGVRVAYRKGRLEIMSPSPKHEKIKAFVHDLVTLFCHEKRLTMENLGSTTFKRKRDEQGAEPDVCFYVTHLEQIIGKDEVDPDSGPPPDVVVEVDVTNESAMKFEIYAAFGVPELWRYHRGRFFMYRLSGARYIEISSSDVFAGLTASVLADFIEQSSTQGRTAALAAFRDWIRAKPL